MKLVRSAVGALLVIVYFFAGNVTMEASVNCQDSQSCENGVTYYNRECTWQNEPMTCQDAWSVMCAGYPFYGSGQTSFDCQDSVDAGDMWMCAYYPGYCTSTGSGGCQVSGSYCP